MRSRAAGVGDEHTGAAVGEAIADRLGAEQHEERQRDGAELLDGDVDDQDLGALRQMDADDDAAADAEVGQNVGAAVGLPGDLAEAPGTQRAVGLLVEQCRSVGCARRVSLADGLGDVEPRRRLPAKIS